MQQKTPMSRKRTDEMFRVIMDRSRLTRKELTTHRYRYMFDPVYRERYQHWSDKLTLPKQEEQTTEFLGPAPNRILRDLNKKQHTIDPGFSLALFLVGAVLVITLWLLDALI